MIFTPIVLFISSFAQVSTLYLLKITNLQKRDFLSMLILVFSISIFLPYFPSQLILPTLVMLLIFYQYLLAKQTILLSFLSTIITCIITTVSDFSAGFFFVSVLKIPSQDIFGNPLSNLLFNITNSILCILIGFLIGRIIKKNKYIFDTKKYSNKLLSILVINVLSAFLVLYIFSVSIKMYIPSKFVSMTIAIISAIYFVSSFIAIIFYGMYIKKDTELIQKNAESKQLQEYTDMIEHMYGDMRKFKHDYINILSTMNGFIQMNEIDKLKTFFSEKIVPMSNSIDKDDMKLGSLQNLKTIPLKGMLSSKLLQAQNKKLDILIDIVEELTLDDIEVIDLCRIVGILVDNAMEAAEKSKEKLVRLAFIQRENSKIIIIMNSIPDNLPPIHKMFKKGFSTKGTNRGLGLATVNAITHEYNNLTLNTSIEDSRFIQELNILTK